MRAVIYLCSFGDPLFREMARLCVRSLRGPGRYAGPIVVFTNNGYRAQDRDRVIRIPRHLDWFDVRHFKALARHYIDGSAFDVVLSMDTDMIAIQDIGPLLEYSSDYVCGMQESPWTRMSDRSCGASLSAGERRVARGRWGINAGLLCTPGSRYQEYMELWDAEIRAHRARSRTWINQPPFNALVFRGQIRFKAYPRAWIEMPSLHYLRGQTPRITAATRVLHYCWPTKVLSLIEMEEALARRGVLT